MSNPETQTEEKPLCPPRRHFRHAGKVWNVLIGAEILKDVTVKLNKTGDP